MNGLLGALALALCVGIIILVPEGGAAAVTLLAALTAVALVSIYHVGSDRRFLLQLFTIALLMRVMLGTFTYVLNLQEFFGGDALAYDQLGDALLRVWQGGLRYEVALRSVSAKTFYGMSYIIASVSVQFGCYMMYVHII